PSRQRRGIPPGRDAHGEIIPQPLHDACRDFAGEDRVEYARSRVLDLSLREWVQTENRQSAGERIGQMRNEQDVGRSREDEASGTTASVDRRLERGEQLGHALEFVENRLRRQRGHEPGRIAARGGGEIVVVEGEIAIAERLADGPRQGGFAALPRAVDEHRGRIAKGLPETRGEEALERAGAAWHASNLPPRSAER